MSWLRDLKARRWEARVEKYTPTARKLLDAGIPVPPISPSWRGPLLEAIRRERER